jgi:phage host-nuclease inhibitor protein Gam
MTEEQIKSMLDQLDEFHCQRDSIAAEKQALLDEVKIPDEIIDIQRQANEAVKYREGLMNERLQSLREQTEQELSEITIPEEIRAALAEIDRKRREISDRRDAEHKKAMTAMNDYRAEIQQETEAKTRQVYDDISARKREISAEYQGKEQAAAENIAKLEKAIKEAAREHGKTVKGKHFSAVYVKGRVSWNTDMLDGMIALVPQLEKARKEGEPSITIRKS